MQQRHFTSGSRQAPDPYDQYLESHQYYRKHTARDSSCLFRVISEQMYDTQLHHLVIRDKCVTYMRKHRNFFQRLVDRDYDEYLDDMSKPKTYGTLLELQAAGCLFQRNVLLFEPFTLGYYFNEFRTYFKEIFRIFYTPERHFDSVFTSEYIEEVAICQSICYEILYKDVFKLPDVSLAVEQMLHGQSFDSMEYRTEVNEEGYATRLHLKDGRAFELDLPNHTDCILENYKLCHFHYPNFPRFSSDLKRELLATQSDDNEKNILLVQRTAESFLPNKFMSCVRQLLQDEITPFPYKVAKALDPNMYRNIEFDSWNEMRKELKLQNWYNGDGNFKLIRYHTSVRKILQVGAKCHVKLRKSEQDLYTCHIQEIAFDKGQCIVYIEQLGEKRLVPYENLSPLPPDQFKPWTMPYRVQRHLQKFSSFRFTRQCNYRFKFNATTEHHRHHKYCSRVADSDSWSNGDYIKEDDDPKRYLYDQNFVPASSYYKLNRFTHLENFQTQSVEFCTMPLTVEHTAKVENGDSTINGNQGGHNDLNEISRATSRSSNATAVSDNAETHADGTETPAQDHFYAPIVEYGMPHGEVVYDFQNYNPEAAIYVPELQSFCHMYPYSSVSRMPEDYYAYYGFDGGMVPAPAFMSGMNGYYYVNSNGTAIPGSYMGATGNPYMATPALAFPAPPPGNVQIYANVPAYPSSNWPATRTSSTSSQYAGHNSSSPHPTQRQGRTAAGADNQSICNTPRSGRINYDAKRSYKLNGSDLPNDIHTLRYFYNLGWDSYQQKQTKQSSEENQVQINSLNVKKDECDALTTDLQAVRLDENGNQIRHLANSDGNNNAIGTEVDPGKNTTNDKSSSHASSTQNNGNSRNQPTFKTNQRRYNARYSGKDRQSQNPQQQQYRNNHMPSNSNAGGYNRQHNQSHHLTRNQNNGSYKYGNNIGEHKPSSAANSGRNGNGQSLSQHHQQYHANRPQQLTPNHIAMMTEYGNHASPMYGGYGNEIQHIPIAPIKPAHGAYVGEHMNDSPVPVSFPATPGGVYVSMPPASAPPPLQQPQPYGLFAAQPIPPQGYPSNSGHPNIVNGSMQMPPSSLMAGAGSDSTENKDLPPGPANYPPPQISYYVAAGVGGIPPPPSHVNAIGSGPNGNANNIHMPTHVPPPTPTIPNIQQPFSAVPPHPSMSGHPQGFFRYPPPLPQLQQIQQPSPRVNNNRSGPPLPAGVLGPSTADSPSNSNNCGHSDLSGKND